MKVINKGEIKIKIRRYLVLLLLLFSFLCGIHSTGTASFVRSAQSNKQPAVSAKAKYISGLDLSKKKGPYYKTTKEEYIETTRFVLYLGKNVSVPVNVIELIDYIMDMIEKETGYKFYAGKRDPYSAGMSYELDTYFQKADKFKQIDFKAKKIGIAVCDNSEGPYAKSDGILIGPEHIRLNGEEAYAVIHELLHVVYYHNGISMEGVFDEGFATYYTARILDKDTRLNCTYDSYKALSDYPYAINEKDMEQLYIIQAQGSARYKLGFRFMHYIIEEYGDDAFRKLREKIAGQLKEGEQATTQLIAKVIKKELSKSFFADFAKWHKENRDRFGDKDISAYGDWHIEYGTLYKYYGSDTHVTVPDQVNFINAEAFIYCLSVESVTVPESVYFMGAAVFYGCKNLKEVSLPDTIETMYYSTFEECTSLEKVKLPGKLKEIPFMTFYNCSSLKTVKLPQGITKIGNSAFSGCSSLEKITLPDGLEEVGDFVFAKCVSLKKIQMPDSVKKLGPEIFYNCTKLKEVVLSKNIKKIEDGMFFGCSSLKSIKIPEGVTEIGNNAFSGSGLIEVKIPKNVTKIGNFAFELCKKLKKIEIPESVKIIGENAFLGCNNITIYGKKGSYAEKYAKEHNIKFIAKK